MVVPAVIKVESNDGEEIEQLRKRATETATRKR